MTHKQKLFIQYYLSTQNATKAAELSGYSVRSACSIGSELLRKPDIRKVIEQQTHERINALIADRSERMQFLTSVMRNVEENTKERIKAAELLSRIDGDFVNRSTMELKTTDTLTEFILKECNNEDKD